MRAAETLVIVNPKSRGGRTARLWPELEPKVRAALGPLRVEWTRGRGDAERIALEGARSGAARVLVAGGDGTASEAATGLLGAGTRAALGLLPLGTGSDLARALGTRGDLEGAVAAMAAGRRRRIDVGRVSSASGGQRYFLNIASFGLSGEVVAALARGDERSNRGLLSYAAGAVGGLARWASPPVRVTVDGRVAHDGPLTLVAVANGRYFGGGMEVAPEAELDDGLLDVVIARGTSRARLLRFFPRIYRGTHLALPEVDLVRGRSVEAESDASLWIEADGEPLFTLPARVEVLPSALELLG